MIAIGPWSRRAARLVLPGAFISILIGCASPSKPVPPLTAAAEACPAVGEPSTPPLPLGCANRENLRAMVADPADLAQGRALTPASGAREANAVETYLKGPKAKAAEGSTTTRILNAASPASGDN